MAKTGRGPRVSYEFPSVRSDNGKQKEGIIRVKLTTARFFGFKPATIVRKSKRNTYYTVRGEKGGQSFKVILFDGKTDPPSDGSSAKKISYISLPAPSSYTIRDIIKACDSFPKNKPKFIVSPDGRWYSVDTRTLIDKILDNIPTPDLPTLPGLPGNPFPGLGGSTPNLGGVLQLPGN